MRLYSKKMSDKRRHILGISGGKDSTALAIHLKDRIPEMEYVFCDTGKELPEVYDYINRLEAFLGQHIVRLPEELPEGGRNDFDHLMKKYGNFLPSPMARWCTADMKLKPFEDYIGDDAVDNYVGIRVDEQDRKGYMTSMKDVQTVFPFIEDGIDYNGVVKILEESGIGIPDYYKWRSRSGCYFCFYQRPSEWVGLKENHPELFEEAKKYEKYDKETGKSFTWRQRESLEELEKPERMKEIKENAKINAEKAKKLASEGTTLIERLDAQRDMENDKLPCTICHL